MKTVKVKLLVCVFTVAVLLILPQEFRQDLGDRFGELAKDAFSIFIALLQIMGLVLLLYIAVKGEFLGGKVLAKKIYAEILDTANLSKGRNVFGSLIITIGMIIVSFLFGAVSGYLMWVCLSWWHWFIPTIVVVGTNYLVACGFVGVILWLIGLLINALQNSFKPD